mmetsp:Transcript_6349/g.11591  ORF Transcript_6349/g.11591 Transcript_6349/m.11591 type:complete len:610 (-) Transcript_6349:93-1922(-)|eukprot:CAMPEP_0201628338 /NCGR_PEP_ID=MMETSP0493-20130528/3312_1 /ASSEMBLY_ACC=CAM_ASM_000838 /TAXON_ID=420259 /ORGANISM="Thalassiosira gravida, Strain GMp14c1" /LENGTH=609 /DNA_ID=CAMNT_0048099071 /DNA_START=197 /DNA_END=2026 /DNA_ORIENTATION=+
MTAPILSSGVATAASLLAFAVCNIGSGDAYVSPSTNHLHGRRSHVCTMASPTSDFDSVSGSSSSSEGIHEKKSRSKSSSSPLGPSSLPYIRIQKRGRHYDVQTAITTFQKSVSSGGGSNSDDSIGNNPTKKTAVDLHAQIHFGDASYFQYFNDDTTFASHYDKILYELIVEDKFLSRTTIGIPSLKQLRPASSGPGSPLSNPIAPTQSDRSTASQYGLQCQVDGIQYCKEDWVHADLTREEFLDWLEYGQQRKEQQTSSLQQQSVTNNRRNKDAQQPLWALASTAATYPGSELVTSLMRPLTTTSNSAALTRRLFTHLFLPGDALSGWIRAILWFGVPSPELSIMLVDWSSLSHHIGSQSRRRRASEKGSTNNIGPISPIAAPVFLSLLTGNWGTARRLVFGQVLVGGQSNADTSKGGVLIEKRNERAMDVLRDSLSSLENADDNGKRKRIALLYGAGHCKDLHRRLVQEEGMTPVRTEWRTAFRATAPRWGDFVNVDDWKAKTSDIASSLPSSVLGDGEGIFKSMSVSTLESVAVGLVILPLYLLVGGLDWVSTMGDLGKALDGGLYLDGFADVLLYLVRHVALYVGISKFVVDWGGNEGIFDDDERA